MTQTTYTPEHLTRWTRPDSYMGAEWPEYFSAGCGRHRDSDALARANFDAMLAALKAVPEPADWTHDFAAFQVVSASHWAVGWVEWVAIHQDATAHLECADKIKSALQSYPVVDEELFSQYETDEANETWRNCYRPAERVEYIRKHEDQFHFHNFADLLGCVRGKYFAGHASELLN